MNHEEIAICDKCWKSILADSDWCPDEVAMRLDDGAVRTVPVFDSCVVCEMLTVVGEADWTDEDWDAAFGMAAQRLGWDQIEEKSDPHFMKTAHGSKIHLVRDVEFGYSYCEILCHDEVVTAHEATCKKCLDIVFRFGL